jgi:hypothetical protein
MEVHRLVALLLELRHRQVLPEVLQLEALQAANLVELPAH